mmetsp:Transcript_23919/g.27412  ORF Transcript_23919/g.27412 Transcript_23919/m.27412 type:complete len:99 (-) Transcript_23919:1353-1649(-)
MIAMCARNVTTCVAPIMQRSATHGYSVSVVVVPSQSDEMATNSTKNWDAAAPTNNGAQKCPPTIPVERLSPVTKIFANTIDIEHPRLRPELSLPSTMQ